MKIELSKIEKKLIEKEMKGNVLFKSENGITGNITLNDNFSNYKYIEIFYGDSVSATYVIKISTNTNDFTISRFYIDDSMTYMYITRYKVEKDLLSPINFVRGTLPNNLASDLNFNYIYKVVGYK